MKLRQKSYTFRVKWGNKYIAPDEDYRIQYYDKKSIPSTIAEIEGQYPRYKGKVKAFEMVLELVK